jgi:hypothetical protein
LATEVKEDSRFFAITPLAIPAPIWDSPQGVALALLLVAWPAGLMHAAVQTTATAAHKWPDISLAFEPWLAVEAAWQY